MQIVPIILGPTGIGKTFLSTLISRKLPIEIVSADSRQIYRFLDVGTAKPAKNILVEIPHHLIDFLRPDEYFSSGMYSKIARKIIKQINERGNVALVVGGSGLYIKALVDGFFELEVRDEKVRSSLRNRIILEGCEKLYDELKQVDPVIATKIQKEDKQRIIRALEVYIVSGTPLSQLQEEESVPADFISVMYGLTAERKFLYHRINERVENMLNNGLLSEAAKLKRKGFTPELNSLNTVGYKEVFDYSDNKITYDELVERIKRNSRRYAKRQMTWFRKDERIQWIDIKDDTDFIQLADGIVEDYWRRTSSSR